MLSLRTEDMAMFSDQVRMRFHRNALQHVQRCWPRESEHLGPERLQTYVDNCIADAESRGLRSARDVILFIDLTILLDCQAEEVAFTTPWIAEIFAREDLLPTSRLRIVWYRMTADIRRRSRRESGR